MLFRSRRAAEVTVAGLALDRGPGPRKRRQGAVPSSRKGLGLYLQCPMCDREVSLGGFAAHVKRDHAGNSIVTCHHFSCTRLRLDNYVRHLRKCHGLVNHSGPPETTAVGVAALFPSKP